MSIYILKQIIIVLILINFELIILIYDKLTI